MSSGRPLRSGKSITYLTRAQVQCYCLTGHGKPAWFGCIDERSSGILQTRQHLKPVEHDPHREEADQRCQQLSSTV